MADEANDYEAAIKAEAVEWAAFFGVTDPSEIEARERVMRANVAVGHIGPLLQYIEAENRCPKCGDLPTYQTPDGTYWDSNAHFWRKAHPETAVSP